LETQWFFCKSNSPAGCEDHDLHKKHPWGKRFLGKFGVPFDESMEKWTWWSNGFSYTGKHLHELVESLFSDIRAIMRAFYTGEFDSLLLSGLTIDTVYHTSSTATSAFHSFKSGFRLKPP
jgi:hypothetical protein